MQPLFVCCVKTAQFNKIVVCTQRGGNNQIHSVVGIATRYRLDSPGIEFRWRGGGEIFRTRPDRPWGPSSLLYNGYRVSFPGVKRPGSGTDHPHLSNAEVKERVHLYVLPLWAFVACYWVNCTFTFNSNNAKIFAASRCGTAVYIVTAQDHITKHRL